MLDALSEKINKRTAKLGIVGFGYVGLPLAMEFLEAGFDVTGIDLDSEKVEMINRGESYIGDVPSESVALHVGKGKLRATADFSVIKDLDCINICVPTPLRKTKDPDVSYIVNAVNEINEYYHDGSLIILESTTYPGTTTELILPILSRDGKKKVGKDFFLAFSPERVDPGNKEFTTKNVPKVVGGVTEQCTKAAVLLYQNALENVFSVSSTDVAEMVKLLENTFRSVNIGLVNEIALMCDRMGINVWEVIDAAATKPFGFMPFYPGPGLGGHCIPIDPFYLSWKARSVGFESRFIELAGDVNNRMPRYVANKIGDILNMQKKSVNGANILLVGVAYKRDISDLRESPALDIITLLEDQGAELHYCDSYVPKVKTGKKVMESLEMSSEVIRKMDTVVIITDHSDVDYSLLVRESVSIFDTRNCLKSFNNKKIHRL